MLRYRSDIDGLRALAVLGVVIFHLQLGLLPGGHTGVDIFFVISGYLISKTIFEEIANSDFSIAKFYVRRARRILPGFLSVVILTSVAAYLFLFPIACQLCQVGNCICIICRQYILLQHARLFFPERYRNPAVAPMVAWCRGAVLHLFPIDCTGRHEAGEIVAKRNNRRHPACFACHFTKPPANRSTEFILLAPLESI